MSARKEKQKPSGPCGGSFQHTLAEQLWQLQQVLLDAHESAARSRSREPCVPSSESVVSLTPPVQGAGRKSSRSDSGKKEGQAVPGFPLLAVVPSSQSLPGSVLVSSETEREESTAEARFQAVRSYPSETEMAPKTNESEVSERLPTKERETTPDALVAQTIGAHGGVELEVGLGLELLPVWKKRSTTKKDQSHRHSALTKGDFSTTDFSSLEVGDVSADKRGTDLVDESPPWKVGGSSCRPQQLAVHPNAQWRMVWDCLSLIMVVYDMIAIPFQLFDPPESVLEDATSWATRMFWSLDIPLSFLSGFMRTDGFVEMRLKRIANHYLTTWFLLDFVIVGADWLELLWGISSGQTYARMGKASRTVRIIRMLRLLRMLRLWSLTTAFAERLQSEKLSISMNIGKLMIVVMAWSHLTACIWYGIGNREAEYSWLKMTGMYERSLGYRYLTSLHWALCQFTGGMDEITPSNYYERIYVITIYITGFVMAAAFTSILTSSLTRLHLLTSGQSKQVSYLRRYLVQNGISNKLAIRVQRNAQMGSSLRHIPEDHVELLAMVSKPLRVEIHFEMHSPTLNMHSFFLRYGQDYPHVMRQVCHTATNQVYMTCGDTFFNAGEISEEPKMIFVRSGGLDYLHMAGHCTTVAEGQHVSEASLWVRWVHRGTLRSRQDCTALELDARKFQDIVSRFEHPLFCPWRFAAKYLQVALHVELSDLMFVDIESIMMDLRSETQGSFRRQGHLFSKTKK